MNAPMRRTEMWFRSRRPYLRLVRVSSDATRVGIVRAADVIHFLLAYVTKVARGGMRLWRLLLVPPVLLVRKSPDKAVTLEEEYASLREKQPMNPFTKF